MGIDAGFDMVPRLSKGVVDRHNWDEFIRRIKDLYEDDENVEVKPNYIEFKAGEHPLLPFEGHKFLRFSSKVSGRDGEMAQEYINKVATLARISFGYRVRKWSEMCDLSGHYGWKEVHESIRSYEQPDENEVPMSIAQYMTGEDPLKDLDLARYEVKSIPDKGKGLVARFNIVKGTRILIEKPLFTLASTTQRAVEADTVAKVKALPKEKQRQYLSLHNNYPGRSVFSGIFKTNALPCGAGSEVGAVYPTICLINHSCGSNAHASWNSDMSSETVHALRNIQAGEEITIAYSPHTQGVSSSRRARLKTDFGFDCNCNLCSLPASELRVSDARRLRIEKLDEAIGDAPRMIRAPAKALEDCHEMMSLLKDEYDDRASALEARLYYDAFQLSIMHGDQARASIFTEKGYKARIVCEGEDCPEAARMKRLMDSPATHMAFGTSQKWRSKKNTVPKGLSEDEFEKWLWRQN